MTKHILSVVGVLMRSVTILAAVSTFQSSVSVVQANAPLCEWCSEGNNGPLQVVPGTCIHSGGSGMLVNLCGLDGQWTTTYPQQCDEVLDFCTECDWPDLCPE